MLIFQVLKFYVLVGALHAGLVRPRPSTVKWIMLIVYRVFGK